MHDLDKIRAASEPVLGYVETCREKAPSLHEQYETYLLDEEAVSPDCHRNVPILALLHREAGLEVRVFGHLMRDAKNGNCWNIPPSPPEVNDFDVIKIPHIVVMDMNDEVIDEIIENPPEGKTLEQALLDILEA